MTFEESGRRFLFQSPWVARAYDRHTYFQGLSSAGLKGVDFVALLPGEAYLLMEVKNYRRQDPPDPSNLAAELRQKSQDTLRGLDAVHGFLQRAWHRRILSPFWQRWPARQADRAFWTQLCRLRQKGAPPTFLFWLEGERLRTDWRTGLRENLQTQPLPGPVHLAHPGQQPLKDVVVVV